MSMGVGGSVAAGDALARQAMSVGKVGSSGDAAAYYKQAADQAGPSGMNPADMDAAAYFRLAADQAGPSGVNPAAYYKQAADQAGPSGVNSATYYKLSADMGTDIRLFDGGVIPAFAPEGIDPLDKRRRNSGRRRRPVDSVAPKTPGEGVLNSIQEVRDYIRKIENKVESLVSRKQDFAAADLMELQYLVMQLTYINELSSKTADKTSQGAQTLFRNQG
ncbi:MAG: EscI/YscI/HrpB family type III secretion system inner rod protein [Puniceicoccales bacterium]|jgi:hypothetical protein|nr:EscI/YscI/HrpB family type III secretion system inner rod protein [Puniceicoccales bacterium]